MIRRRLRLCLAVSVAAVFGASSAFGQAECTPANLNSAIDAFAAEPFGAQTWRQVNGLGVPDVSADGPAYSGYAASETWRKRVAELAPEMPDLQNTPYDCRLSYPLEVLNTRVSQLGAADPYIKQWLKSQARVLKSCEGAGVDQTTLPDALEVKPELVQVQADDRAYQEASIAFYGSDKMKAVQMFKSIAATQSAHKAAARYNVANLLANAKNLVDARAEVKSILADPTLASVHVITKELQGYIANLEDTAEGWTTLIDGTVATLNQPSAAVTANEKSQGEYVSALYDIDFVGVREKQDDWWVRGELPQNPTLSKALVDASRKQPMALWMMAGQSVNSMYKRAPWSMVGPTWNTWATSYVDRAMGLQPAAAGISGPGRDMIDALKAGQDDASRTAVWAKAKASMDKAKASCGDAAETGAVAGLILQAARLSVQAGRYDEVYAQLGALPLAASLTSTDFVLPELMKSILASGYAEEGRRLRDALLTPEHFAAVRARPDYERDAQLATYSDFMVWVAEDEAKFIEALGLSNAKLSNPVLNLLPAKTLMRLADSNVFDADQKALLSRAAWTREYSRGRTAKAADTAKMLALNPEIKAAFDAIKTAYPKLKAERQWLLTILRNPRFGILVNSNDWTDAIETKRENYTAIDAYDHNDKNWWCPLQQDRQLGALRSAVDQYSGLAAVADYNADELKPVLEADTVAKGEAARDALLKKHPMVKAVDWSEFSKLGKVASAPETLTRAATRWARNSRRDDGAPEALALAAKVVRYGCNWHGGHKIYAKPAHELLQTRFAETAWAKQTPYWFDCVANEWDAQGNKVTTCKPREWAKQKPLR